MPSALSLLDAGRVSLFELRPHHGVVALPISWHLPFRFTQTRDAQGLSLTNLRRLRRSDVCTISILTKKVTPSIRAISASMHPLLVGFKHGWEQCLQGLIRIGEAGVSFGGETPASDQIGEKSCHLVRHLPQLRLGRLGEMGDYRRIDQVGLSPFAERLREGAHLRRIDHHHWQACASQARRDHRLKAAGSLDHHQLRR
jgi:hypothetical protein